MKIPAPPNIVVYSHPGAAVHITDLYPEVFWDGVIMLKNKERAAIVSTAAATSPAAHFTMLSPPLVIHQSMLLQILRGGIMILCPMPSCLPLPLLTFVLILQNHSQLELDFLVGGVDGKGCFQF